MRIQLVVRGVELQQRSAVEFFLMMRRPPRSTLDRSSAASDVYKRQAGLRALAQGLAREFSPLGVHVVHTVIDGVIDGDLSLIHISEPTRPY